MAGRQAQAAPLDQRAQAFHTHQPALACRAARRGRERDGAWVWLGAELAGMFGGRHVLAGRQAGGQAGSPMLMCCMWGLASTRAQIPRWVTCVQASGGTALVRFSSSRRVGRADVCVRRWEADVLKRLGGAPAGRLQVGAGPASHLTTKNACMQGAPARRRAQTSRQARRGGSACGTLHSTGRTHCIHWLNDRKTTQLHCIG